MSIPQEPSHEGAQAVVETRRRFSIVWIVPITAVLIGAWLVYKAQTEKGPTVTITFTSAAGIVAGKTKVKFKEVEVGTVDAVELDKSLNNVNVTVTFEKGAEPHLTDETRFWIVRPRLGAGQITGLGTLFTGVYIGMEPATKGTPQRKFKGLEEPPVIAAETPGREFVLRADSIGSLGPGSPIFFRKLEAGKVESHKLSKDNESVLINIFINAPFDQLVDVNTRFWNASGISASMTADGIKVRTESLASILIGGVAFDTPDTLGPRKQAEEGHVFTLHDTPETATAPVFERKRRMLVYFDQSVRGLSIGAPVEVHGIKLGEVVDIKLVGELIPDTREISIRVPVLIETEPDRMTIVGAGRHAETMDELVTQMSILVEQGFRGQLKTGSLLTGQLFVDFDFYPDAEPAEIRLEDGIIVLPTVRGQFQEIGTDLAALLKRVHEIPIEQIGNDLRDTIHGASQLTNSEELRQALVHLNRTLANSEQLTADLNEATPALQATLDETINTLTLVQKNFLREDSPVYHEITRALEELSSAARSIRVMADYLERHPDALLTGK